jgi:hypothetical protein
MDNPTEKETAKNGDDGDTRNELGRFSEGNTGGPGRPKGAPNKVNALLKEDIAEAYQQRGGIEWLKGLKDRDFVRLLEKTMPKAIVADLRGDEKVSFTINFQEARNYAPPPQGQPGAIENAQAGQAALPSQ